MPIKFSCKNCTKRTSTCHSTCESYLVESEQNRKERELRIQKQMIGIELHSNGTYYSGSYSGSRKYRRKSK